MSKLKGFDDGVEILWQDKKRIFGLPISFTTYALVCKPGLYTKLVKVSGLLTTRIEEVHCYRVDDISSYQSLTDKMFNVGNINVYCNDASCNILKLEKIKNPLKIKQLINDKVETERALKGMRYAEMAS